jgi:hypothetical protein
MYNDNDSDSGWGLFFTILGGVALYNCGKNKGAEQMHQQMSDAQRDKEISELKMQIEYFRRGDGR